MRIARLELLAFGRFTDHVLEFPAGKPDLHLIIGPNEAGKSTARQAIGDFLFGIPVQSPFNFLHDYADLRIGMRLEADGKGWDFVRKKGNRNTLLDTDGNPLEDAQLDRLLGHADRALFEQMFGLDWQALGQGAEDMLNARGAVGQMLFEASSGLSHLADLQSALRSEAEEAWGPRRSKSKAFYIAADDLKAAQDRLKDAQIRPESYRKDVAAWEQAELAKAKAIDSQKVMRTRLMKLQRIRNLSPTLARLEATRAALAALDGARELPADARKRYDDCRQAVQHVESRLELRRQDLANAREHCEAIEPPAPILKHIDRVREQSQRAEQYRAYPSDISRREQEIAACQALACEKARDLGWGELQFAEVQARRVTRIQLARLREAAGQFGVLSDAVQHRQSQLDSARQDIEELRTALAGAAVQDIPQALRQACGSAQLAVARNTDKVDLLTRLRMNEAELSTVLKGLAPWSGSIDELRVLPEVDPALAAELRKDADNHRRDEHHAIDQLRQCKTELESCVARISALRSGQAAVSSQDVGQARALRDGTWQAMLSQDDVRTHAEQFETQLHGADDLADRRYAHAEDTHRLETELAEQLKLERRIRQFDEEIHIARDRLGQTTARWSQILSDAGLPALDWSTYANWCARRREVLERAAAGRELNHQIAALDLHADDARKAILTQLAAAGIGDLDRELDLRQLTTAVELRIEKADAGRAEHDSTAKQLQHLESRLPALENALGVARGNMQNWERSWTETLKSMNLPEQLSPASADDIIDTLTDISAAIDKAIEIRRSRVDTMQADLRSLLDDARSLAQELNFPIQDLDGHALIDSLALPLQAAQAVEKRREELTRTAAAADADVSRLELECGKAKAGLTELLERASLKDEDWSALDEAIRRSDQRRELLVEAAQLERELIEQGDGLTLNQLQQEADGEDHATLRATLEQLKADEESASELAIALTERAAECGTRVQELNSEGDAAAAEFDRQSALAAMADAASRYIRARIQDGLLAAGIEHFRSRHQTPILELASDLFRQCTCAAFDGLEVNWDQEPPRLVGVRNKSRIGVEAMSDGTRDQLYLSLRLAALQLQVSEHGPLPFIADDLFVNGDDQRSFAAFAALGKLATQTQVLYFTHHAHLEAVAREALGSERLNVLRLE